jgi:hypothetical protein
MLKQSQMKPLFLLAKKTGISTTEGFSTVLISLIILTPYCGFLFDCGCTWPWRGLESHCNIHDPLAEHQCPWCASLLSGVLSSATSVLAALFFSTQFVEYFSQPNRSPFTIKFWGAIVSGLSGFIVIATATGWIAGYLQDYPTFIF